MKNSPSAGQKAINEAKEELENALKEANTRNEIAKKKFETSEKDLYKKIKSNDIDKLFLDELKNHKKKYDQISQCGTIAAEIAKDNCGATVAYDIIEAAKSIKTVLYSIEKAHSDANHMELNALNVDEIKEGEIKKLIIPYTKIAKEALDKAKKCKNASYKAAIISSEVNVKVKTEIEGIIDLSTKIQTIVNDHVACVLEQQKAIEDADKKIEELKTSNSVLNLEKIKSDLEYNTIKAYSKPEESLQAEKPEK